MDMCICSFLFVYIDTYTYRACTCNFIQSISWYTMIIRWSCHVWVRWPVLCAPGSLLSDASAMANVRCSFGTPVPQRGRPYSMDTRIWLAKLRRWGSGICLDAGWCWRMDDQKAVGSGFCLGLNLSLLGEACRSRGIGNWHWAGLMIPPWSFGISRQGGLWSETCDKCAWHQQKSVIMREKMLQICCKKIGSQGLLAISVIFFYETWCKTSTTRWVNLCCQQGRAVLEVSSCPLTHFPGLL